MCTTCTHPTTPPPPPNAFNAASWCEEASQLKHYWNTRSTPSQDSYETDSWYLSNTHSALKVVRTRLKSSKSQIKISSTVYNAIQLITKCNWTSQNSIYIYKMPPIYKWVPNVCCNSSTGNLRMPLFTQYSEISKIVHKKWKSDHLWFVI